jgi:hypothetical protein
MGIKITEHNVKASAAVVGVKVKMQIAREAKIATSRLEAVVRAICEKLGEDFDALANGVE